MEDVDSEEYIQKMKRETDRDPGNVEARENLVSVMGIVDANWESKDGFANSLLSLDNENLDKVVEWIIDK